MKELKMALQIQMDSHWADPLSKAGSTLKARYLALTMAHQKLTDSTTELKMAVQIQMGSNWAETKAHQKLTDSTTELKMVV